MSARDLVLALDQGTTSSRALVVDRDGSMIAAAQQEFPQGFPSPGHVTHDPEDIWQSQVAVARAAIEATPGGVGRLAAIGITNQRETTVVWERASGRPVAPAIVWQSRITARACESLREAGHEARIRALTGLPIDAYFSGTKVGHILESSPDLRARAEAGDLCFGTIDSFLLWRLSGGRTHATDVSNASRTLLFDIDRLTWDPWLCEVMGVPMAMLPEVLPSSGFVVETDPDVLGVAVPVAGVAGDQQAATFGQACFTSGSAKTTYGTGAFALLNTGSMPVASANGLLTTVLWQLGAGEHASVAYALEGSVFVAGAAVQWLRDGLGIIGASGEVEAIASEADPASGVVVVPAFVGLGAPHWDPHARGAILGLTRGTTAADIARATVDATAYQVSDVLEAMAADAEGAVSTLRVDGGAARNDGLLQLQADLLGAPVERPRNVETTAMGAAFLAGLAVGVWSGLDEVAATWKLERRFEPRMGTDERARLVARWHDAVERTKGWAAAD